MTKKNTKEQIIKNAALLFSKNEYKGTSVKQIADATGCTAPALYYFFPGGKSELLQAVVRSLDMDPKKALAELKTAQSLEELVELINLHLPRLLEVVSTDIRWLHNEMDQLPEEETAFVHDTILSVFEIILIEAKRFIPREEDARHFAWIIFFIHQGHMDLFKIYNINLHDSLTQSELNQAVLALFKQSYFSNPLFPPKL